MTAFDRLALGPALDAASAPLASLRFAFAQVRRAVSIRRERHALSLLDARLLQDIGVGQADAEAEARRDFFDIPAGR